MLLSIPREVIEHHVCNCYRVYILIKLTCKEFNKLMLENKNIVYYYKTLICTRKIWIKTFIEDLCNLRNIYNLRFSVIGELFDIKHLSILAPLPVVDIYYKCSLITIICESRPTKETGYSLFDHKLIGNPDIIKDFCKYLYDNYPELTKYISLVTLIRGSSIFNHI